MKRVVYLVSFIALLTLILVPVLTACSSTPSPTSAAPPPATTSKPPATTSNPPTTSSPPATSSPVAKPTALPDVPVKYEGDTDETILRRAKLVEAAKKEGKLTLWGPLTVDQYNTMIPGFKKIYPFIEVTYWRSSGQETKYEAEAASGKITDDVNLGSIDWPRFPVWRQNGWLMQWTDVIPNVTKARIAKELVSNYKDWALPGENALLPGFNTNLVKPADAPKSWDDLLDPKWKGKIGVATPPGIWETIAYAEGGWGPEKTLTYLTKLKAQNIVWLQDYLAGYGLMQAGEVAIMVNTLLPHYITAKAKGAPVDWVRVDPVPISGPSYTIPKGAPNPNAAQLFLEWQFSPEGLSAYEKAGGKGDVSPGSTTQLAQLLTGRKLAINTEDTTNKVIKDGFTEKIIAAIGLPK